MGLELILSFSSRETNALPATDYYLPDAIHIELLSWHKFGVSVTRFSLKVHLLLAVDA